jgi:glutathione synthase/RimK-type ligase-like ATP-grasp enzyme
MATVLIPTILQDVHAAAAAVALERMGHRPIRWFCSDVPQLSAASLRLNCNGLESLLFHDYFGALALDEVDVFWNRRLGDPVVTHPLVEADKNVAASESRRFVKGVLATVSQRVFSVNGYHQARMAEDKFTQLAVARELGLHVPQTLISNDPAQIRSFFAEHAEQGVIFKSFSPASWEGEDSVSITFTAKISSDSLPRDEMLRLTPCIFQAYVPKAYELRVTVMGEEVVAVRLESQGTQMGRVDWRMVSPEELNITRVQLPADLHAKCVALVRRMNLCFGCVDFVVTPEGEYTFLEINQMGQFLWIEQANPTIPLLQMFCDFLVARDAAFTYAPRAEALSFLDLVGPACDLIEEDQQAHMRPEKYPNVYRE